MCRVTDGLTAKACVRRICSMTANQIPSASHLPRGFQEAFSWNRYFPQADRKHFLGMKEITAKII